jgi:hypothetical protein
MNPAVFALLSRLSFSASVISSLIAAINCTFFATPLTRLTPLIQKPSYLRDKTCFSLRLYYAFITPFSL